MALKDFEPNSKKATKREVRTSDLVGEMKGQC
jgi:hypothetical protein